MNSLNLPSNYVSLLYIIKKIVENIMRLEILFYTKFIIVPWKIATEVPDVIICILFEN